jgi:hypothetical protein
MCRECIIGILIASYISSVHADDLEDATAAAYCVGVYQSDIEGLRARFKADSREVEMKQSQKRTFVEGAITQGKIDSETVSNMQNVGYSEESGTDLTANNSKARFCPKIYCPGDKSHLQRKVRANQQPWLKWTPILNGWCSYDHQSAFCRT